MAGFARAQSRVYLAVPLTAKELELELPDRLRQRLFRSPLLKALFPGLFSILANVLAGAYIFSITETDHGQIYLAWKDSPQVICFWLIIALLAATCLYGKWLHDAEMDLQNEIHQYRDHEYIRARVTRDVWDALMEKVRNDLRTGNIKTMDEVLAVIEPRERDGSHE